MAFVEVFCTSKLAQRSISAISVVKSVAIFILLMSLYNALNVAQVKWSKTILIPVLY